MGKFKLITGLGNKDGDRVFRLVSLYMRAGADIFDVSPDVLLFIEEKLKKDNFNLNDYDFCISVALEGDIHGKKAKINPEKCNNCGNCKEVCIENAINPPYVDEKKCIGCLHCAKVCAKRAIEFYDDKNNALINLIKEDVKIDTVEVHISTENNKIIKDGFKKIINFLDNSKAAKNSKISVCFNRKYFSNNEAEKILSELKFLSKKRKFLVQADGNPMNLAKNDIAGTIETVAFGLFVKSLGYDVILSGGCNEYTAKLAKEAGLKCSIGYGSFARKIVENKTEIEALKVAKEFVKNTKELLND